MNTCDTCKHWQPTLGREASDPHSTWGTCSQIVSKRVFDWVFMGQRTESEQNDQKPHTPKSFGCICHEPRESIAPPAAVYDTNQTFAQAIASMKRRGLTARAAKCIWRHKLSSMEDLCPRRLAELKEQNDLRNCGLTTLNDIEEWRQKQ